MKRLVILLILLKQCFFPVFALNDDDVNFSPLKWTEQKPAAYQAQALLADVPQGRPVLNRASKDLWMVGTNYAWKWNLGDGSVSRLELPTGHGSHFRFLKFIGSFLIGLDEKNFWSFHVERKIWRPISHDFRGSLARKAMAVGLVEGSAEKLQLLNDGVLHIFSHKNDALTESHIELLPAMIGQSFTAATAFQNNTILFAANRELKRLVLAGERFRLESVYVAKSQILGVGEWFDRVFVWTPQAVVILGQDMSRQQVVPVVGGHKITAFGLSGGLHAVLFNDGTIELMSMTSRKKWATRINDYEAQFVDFTEDEEFIVLSSGKRVPRVFNVTSFR
jgi:hypothetical protein